MDTIFTVISGGQTGVDLAGLDAAKEVGFLTGGYAPKSFMNKTGFHPEFAEKYNLRETSDYSYRKRTILNIMTSDGTLIIGRTFDRGTGLTVRQCKLKRKPHKVIKDQTPIPEEDVVEWIKANNITKLNIAGNRESKSPGIYSWSYKALTQIFAKLNTELYER